MAPFRRRIVGDAASLRRCGRGQSLVEFALVLPLMLLFLLLAADFGRLFYTWLQLNNAAREGAAYAAANPTDSAPGGGIWARVNQEKNAQGQAGEGAITVSVTCAAGRVGSPLPTPTAIACADAPGGSGPGNTVTVTVQEPFNFITPVLPFFAAFVAGGSGGGSNGVTLSSSATAAVMGLAATGNAGLQCNSQPSLAAFSFSVEADGLTVDLDASWSQQTTGQNAITGYFWDFGDGSSTPWIVEGLRVKHSFASRQPYSVALQVRNGCGATTATQSVDLTPPTPPPGPTPTPTATPTPTPSPTPTPRPTPTPTAAPQCSTELSFSYTPSYDRNGKPSILVTAGYTGVPAPNSFTWQWGDGTTSPGANQQNTSKIYGPFTGHESSVTYRISLTATTTQPGCRPEIKSIELTWTNGGTAPPPGTVR